jgi:hypothetical protein
MHRGMFGPATDAVAWMHQTLGSGLLTDHLPAMASMCQETARAVTRRTRCALRPACMQTAIRALGSRTTAHMRAEYIPTAMHRVQCENSDVSIASSRHARAARWGVEQGSASERVSATGLSERTLHALGFSYMRYVPEGLLLPVLRSTRTDYLRESLHALVATGFAICDTVEQELMYEAGAEHSVSYAIERDCGPKKIPMRKEPDAASALVSWKSLSVPDCARIT